MTIFKNWSGSMAFTPGEIVTPEGEEQVCDLVKKACKEGKKVRVVGAGHSSSPLVRTDDYLLSLEHFSGVEDPDLENHTATVVAGMTVKEAGKDLFRYGLAMHNTGDVDVQTLAGAIGTGTHGTGVELANLSTMLWGVKMVTGTGDIVELNKKNNEEDMKALQVSMGSCGIFLKMQLQLEPAYHLYRKEYCVSLKDCLDHFEDLKKNRNFDFYWYPRTDLCKIRIMNTQEEEMPRIPYGTLDLEKEGPGHEILPRSRHLKFDEMEYVLPKERAIDCFLEVRKEVKENFRREVAWRILVRTIKEDNAYLSPMSGRESVTISLHHNAGLSFWQYFKAIEPVFLKYGGRPHWGKKFTLKAQQLKDMYPNWAKFQQVRKKYDPENTFLTPYMHNLFISGQ
ncbi:D-arabinono-1,4-lactone oxidase [Salinimicrobium oceani]|uniref:FAD-binding protein n=1 Tax=Salinimicrobium oceani TaxID=2722702 RepID=A0ABX1D1U0_9FLAO|nr:D-arabinono-1,4-lactone oxidase [Salinimicrobium oceani]NJW53282.1 FAD-binding protein [Salinimicrobium oceani]